MRAMTPRDLARSISALALTAVLALPITAEAKVSWGGSTSGMPWASGASTGSGELETHRGRKLDFRTMYVSKKSWSGLVRDTNYARFLGSQGSKVIVAVGLMPETHRAQHAQCARGSFDTHIRNFARGLVNAGAEDAVLRLGWEANGSFPWKVTGDGSSYKACFRRWVSVLRSTPGTQFTIDWNMARGGTFPYHIDRMYPGSDVVDVVGVQWYDRCAPVRNEADWNKLINKKARNGGPYGVGAWLAYAKSKRKRLSIPEWGIGGPRHVCRAPGIDNPFFIQRVHKFFRDNAGSIAYEAYFNGHGGPNGSRGSHKLAPANFNPRSAAAYRSLW
jgi:Glycosyl hydrolase family 26